MLYICILYKWLLVNLLLAKPLFLDIRISFQFITHGTDFKISGRIRTMKDDYIFLGEYESRYEYHWTHCSEGIISSRHIGTMSIFHNSGIHARLSSEGNHENLTINATKILYIFHRYVKPVFKTFQCPHLLYSVAQCLTPVSVEWNQTCFCLE